MAEHVLVQKITVLLALIVIGILSITSASANWNNPYSESEKGDNTLYSAFSERPKFLDPVRSYAETEYRFLGNIYEPPLQYHYLHRPYRLQTQTLTQLPDIVFLDSNGKKLKEPVAHSDIAYTEYRFTLQQGILYQPHPALAKDPQGAYYYHSLSPEQTRPIKTLAHLKHTGTRELVADDYIYQIKRMADPKNHSPISGLMQQYIVGLKELATEIKAQQHDNNSDQPHDLRAFNLTGASSSSPYTFRLRIKGQYPQFIYWLAMPFFAPMPWEADVFYAQPGFAKNNISLNWYPIGTGAYMLTENNPNLRMTLEKNPHFRGQRYPSEGEASDKEKGLLYWNKFLQGYFDSSGISSDSFDNAISFGAGGEITLTDAMINKGIHLNTVVNTSIFYLGFNMIDKTVGGDSERSRLLRQAIAIAINYEEYISIFMNGRGIPGQGPIPPGIFGHQEGEAGTNPYVYHWKNNQRQRKTITEAKALMTQAGYHNGIDDDTEKPLTLYYDSVDRGPGSKARLNWLRKQFEKINIQLIIRSTDYNRFREKMTTGATQLFSLGWNADYPDPENFLFLLYGPQGKVAHKGENAVNYANPEFDRLFDQMKNIPNSPERLAIIEQMLTIVQRDAPWIFSFHPKSFSLQHGWYKNTKPFVMTNTGTLKYKRIDKAARAQLREQWNPPILWPLLLIVLLLLALIVPAIIAYRRHEQTRGLSAQ